MLCCSFSIKRILSGVGRDCLDCIVTGVPVVEGENKGSHQIALWIDFVAKS